MPKAFDGGREMGRKVRDSPEKRVHAEQILENGSRNQP